MGTFKKCHPPNGTSFGVILTQNRYHKIVFQDFQRAFAYVVNRRQWIAIVYHHLSWRYFALFDMKGEIPAHTALGFSPVVSSTAKTGAFCSTVLLS